MNSTPENDHDLPAFLKEATTRPHGGFEVTSRNSKAQFDSFLEAVGCNSNLEPGRYELRVDFDAQALGYVITDVGLANVITEERQPSAELTEIATLLGTTVDLEEITDAIATLQAGGPTPDSIMRTLWLVTNIGGGTEGVRIPRMALQTTDWNRAAMNQDTDPATGDTILTAIQRHPAD